MKKRIVSLFLAAVFACALLPMTAFAAPSHPSHSGTDCLICAVADKINALPKRSEITLDNAASVQNQIHAIDRIKTDLTDEQYEELLTLVDQGSNGSGGGLGIPVRYTDAIAAVNALTDGGEFLISKDFLAADGAAVDITDAEVQLRITNLSSNAVTTLTMATLDASANFYSENADGSGWTYRYVLPAGTYRVEELGDNGATVNGQPFVTGRRLFTVDGKQSENSATVTVKAGEKTVATLNNAMQFYHVKAVFEGVNVGGSKLELKGLYGLAGTPPHTYTDGDDPITVQGGNYEMIVTAPEGYMSRVTNLEFNPNGTDSALIGDGAEQGVSAHYITEDGETGTYVITITLEPIAPATPLKIVEQPTDQLAMVGGEAIFFVKATGENLSYQWEVNNGNGWMPILNGMTSTLRLGGMPIEADGQQFRCVITDAHGTSVTSDAAMLHVKDNAPIPETGDGMELFLLAGLAAIAFCGIVGTRKREQN